MLFMQYNWIFKVLENLQDFFVALKHYIFNIER